MIVSFPARMHSTPRLHPLRQHSNQGPLKINNPISRTLLYPSPLTEGTEDPGVGIRDLDLQFLCPSLCPGLGVAFGEVQGLFRCRHFVRPFHSHGVHLNRAEMEVYFDSKQKPDRAVQGTSGSGPPAISGIPTRTDFTVHALHTPTIPSSCPASL